MVDARLVCDQGGLSSRYFLIGGGTGRKSGRTGVTSVFIERVGGGGGAGGGAEGRFVIIFPF